MRSTSPEIDRLLDLERYNKKIPLELRQWELVNQHALESVRSTFNPQRMIHGNPVVITSRNTINGLLRSYAHNQPEWTLDTLREMFGMQDKQKISVDYEDSSGIAIPSVKRLPYLDVLRGAFTRIIMQKGRAIMVKKAAQTPQAEDQILSMRRIRRQAGPPSLPRYPFRLLTPLESKLQRNLYRPSYRQILVKGIHPDKDLQITGCRLCGQLCNKKTGEITARPPTSRVCFDESQTGDWFEILPGTMPDGNV